MLISRLLHSWVQKGFKCRRVVNFLPEKSKKSREQSVMLPDFPVVLSENLPE